MASLQTFPVNKASFSLSLLRPNGFILPTSPPSHPIPSSTHTPGAQWPQLNSIEAKATKAGPLGFQLNVA
uniref:PAF1-like protein, Paf1/RNA polymerase II complex component n=1 Tax=Molossus molossus TaxID=27622 RepID=A0A7J8C9W2_MOLMO|nr:PAF1-like protein, Paf1/RNA polymerase II complex component [Molossus molossus]